MVQRSRRFPALSASGIWRSAQSVLPGRSSILHPAIEIIGAFAALITTLGWVPQVAKVARERRAGDISLFATVSIAAGVLLWTLYGLLIGSWPVILANGITFVFVAAILGMKLRFG
ncbi:MAG: hypothetical protein E5V49_03455 [Mesorhizobium sp.]|nr:hypothetical protein EN848_12050 [bacterium M00.F.Ca.ET.205.01.1.1]TGU55973.1 hypothetical protein EN795_00975 [bacterium M00.F.Ca.ET.152.01.1.1]TGV40603.1 hypothetical protein EN829_003465 [Mesorhizobium sp. M00.F.Ca.ET.186.01.1.1]TGZ45583.1 hypothetical protein EN805_03445 [bacterium M00.F.Ca.ET.162.01.1.1]TJW34490.1 MAG: hypothetical protein E5V49_03455 [Mesorhizobium sp.]